MIDAAVAELLSRSPQSTSDIVLRLRQLGLFPSWYEVACALAHLARTGLADREVDPSQHQRQRIQRWTSTPKLQRRKNGAQHDRRMSKV